MGIGLMAFSVLLSVIDQPQHVAEAADHELRRTTQEKDKDRELVKGKGAFRIAAFGSANTWGAGLENRYDAYPYLLSDEVDNFAMFAGGPNYPSVCTETLVGDDGTYDVILLDFWLKAHQGLDELARRLRNRFPRAFMLFVKLWSPVHARRLPTSSSNISEELTFFQWRDHTLPPDPQINEIVEALEHDDGHWYFPEHPSADSLIAEIRQNVHAFNVRVPKKATAKETLAFYLHFFNKQNAQLSEKGHEFLASIIGKTIKKKLLDTSAEEFVNNGIHGHWGKGDNCHMWYTTGGYSDSYSETLDMVQFDSNLGKFALEVTAPGWFIVRNEFADNRTLYLSFLATIPGYYPNAKIRIGDEDATPIPLIPENPLDRKGAHNPRTVPVGKIPPGPSKIFISAEEHPKAGRFFRLVGIAITNEIATPIEFGFGPQFNM